jgi:hypothetical protein
MSPSRHRTTRAAARAKLRNPSRRRSGTRAWNVVIALVVVAGIAGVLLSRAGDGASAVRPRVADAATGVPVDHWHTFLGVNVCGEWLTNAPSFEFDATNNNIQAGIHSHGDGLIHTHPFRAAEAGAKATVGKFLSYGGWSMSADELNLWTGPNSDTEKLTWRNGDTCPFGQYKGKAGRIVWSVNDKPHDGNVSEYRQQDGQIIAVGFLPKGVKLDRPPTACAALSNIGDLNGAAAPSGICNKEAEDATSTTAASTTAPTSSTP